MHSFFEIDINRSNNKNTVEKQQFSDFRCVFS